MENNDANKGQTNKVWAITDLMITCLWKCVSGNVRNCLSKRKTGIQ